MDTTLHTCDGDAGDHPEDELPDVADGGRTREVRDLGERNSRCALQLISESTKAILGRSVVLRRMNFAAASACTNSCAGFASFFVPTITLTQDAHNRGRHQIGHGSGQHGADAEFGEVVAAVWSQSADAADLDPDGAEVRE